MLSIDILKEESNSAETSEILETIAVCAQRGADIVRQVMSFARGMDGQRVDVQPKYLLTELRNILKDTFPKNIRLDFSVADDIWAISGDPTQMHQILLNLCLNARDAMPEGGTLMIRAVNRALDEHYVGMNAQATPGPYVCLSVTDSGTGMPRGVVDRIFEPFFTTKALNKGTGLGLSTVLAIVNSHEGIVNVDSEPGEGTIFEVYLPANRSSKLMVAGRTRASLPRGSGETILVVDDEAAILSITRQTLESFGYRVLTARDGAEALAIYAAKGNEIAAVLRDMMMPGMDGASLIRELLRLNPAVRIVRASGLSLDAGGAGFAEAGLKHVLTKPYTAESLLKVIRAILDEA